MGYQCHILETEGPCSTLNGMGSTKDRIQILSIRLLEINTEEQPLHICQMLGALVKKDLKKLLHPVGHFQVPLSYDFLNHIQKFLRIKGFHQPAGSTELLALCLEIVTGFRGQHENWNEFVLRV